MKHNHTQIEGDLASEDAISMMLVMDAVNWCNFDDDSANFGGRVFQQTQLPVLTCSLNHSASCFIYELFCSHWPISPVVTWLAMSWFTSAVLIWAYESACLLGVIFIMRFWYGSWICDAATFVGCKNSFVIYSQPMTMINYLQLVPLYASWLVFSEWYSLMS